MAKPCNQGMKGTEGEHATQNKWSHLEHLLEPFLIENFALSYTAGEWLKQVKSL